MLQFAPGIRFCEIARLGTPVATLITARAAAGQHALCKLRTEDEAPYAGRVCRQIQDGPNEVRAHALYGDENVCCVPKAETTHIALQKLNAGERTSSTTRLERPFARHGSVMPALVELHAHNPPDVGSHAHVHCEPAVSRPKVEESRRFVERAVGSVAKALQNLLETLPSDLPVGLLTYMRIAAARDKWMMLKVRPSFMNRTAVGNECEEGTRQWYEQHGVPRAWSHGVE